MTELPHLFQVRNVEQLVLPAGFFESIAGKHQGDDMIQIGVVEFSAPLLDFLHSVYKRFRFSLTCEHAQAIQIFFPEERRDNDPACIHYGQLRVHYQSSESSVSIDKRVHFRDNEHSQQCSCHTGRY